MTGNKIPSLYLHVPFCASVCYYCDFSRQVFRAEAADRWLDAVEIELKNTAVNTDLETIYIGGGTPSCLLPRQLERLLRMLDPYCSHVREYTVECNPELSDESVLGILADHGVNRISMGLQTSDPVLLKEINRRHSAEDVKRLVHQFSRCGISNISLDLIYGLPSQTMEQLDNSINFALSCRPLHLSLYSLTIEPNSVFGRQGLEKADDDLEADMYEHICARLKEEGFEHYEISNFSRPGFASLHNTNVWRYCDFYGIGCGAWGKDRQGRYEHSRSLSEYCADPLYKKRTELRPAEQMFETVMMGLRLSKGISEEDFSRTYGTGLPETYPKTISALSKEGLLREAGGYLSCTDKGWPILNSILVEFMEEAQL